MDKVDWVKLVFVLAVLMIIFLGLGGCQFRKDMTLEELSDAVEVTRTYYLNEDETMWLYLDKDEQFFWRW